MSDIRGYEQQQEMESRAQQIFNEEEIAWDDVMRLFFGGNPWR